MISAIIVAKNEEKNLPDCLKSLKWVDEVLVFDNNSSDKTSTIAKKFASKVFEIKSGSFSDRKNLAVKKAQGEWILFVDADERVTTELKEEIVNLINKNQSQKADSSLIHSAYAIPRRNIILGKELKHGWWPDYVVRLFLKKEFTGFSGDLHEQPSYNGNLGYLDNPLLHLKHDNMSDMVEKTNKWSEIEAKLMLDANHPRMNILRFTSAIFREFWQRFVKERAFLDGTEGVVYGIYQIYSRFLSYAKLWEMQESSKFKVQREKL